MKKFTCNYLKEDRRWDDEFPQTQIEATSEEEAARIFAEQYPSDNPKISISSAWGAPQLVDNPVRRERQKEAEERQRLESFQMLHSSVESVDGNLAGLPYDDLNALIENMRDFPGIRDELGPEECAVREKLYKIAFFDRNLQAGLQTVTPRHPRFSPESGKSPQPSSARSSEVSEVVSYLYRIHYWIRFMGVVLLIQIILAVILMFLLGVAD